MRKKGTKAGNKTDMRIIRLGTRKVKIRKLELGNLEL